MSATSSALTGKSSRERSVCGTTAKRAGARSVPAMGASSPSSTRKSVVLPPPFGPRTPIRSPACSANDTSVSTGARAVAGGQALGLHEGQIPAIGHPRAPAVKPRTIASALARSMVR